MTRRISWDNLVQLVDGDRDLVTLLVDGGLIDNCPEGVCATDVDRVLVCRTLIRELEVNLPGIEIILRMRDELATARRRLAALDPDEPPSPDADRPSRE